MAKKVTGRTDQGTKKFPGDEEYKKMLAEIDKKDKPSKPSKPKMNVQNVSSAVFGRKSGSDESFKNIHGTISKLTGHVRKAVIRIGSLEKKLLGIENNITNFLSSYVKVFPNCEVISMSDNACTCVFTIICILKVNTQ